MMVQDNDYSEIREWAENVYPLANYGSLSEWMSAVKQDFEDSGHYFPQQAEAGLVDSWVTIRGDVSVASYMYDQRKLEDQQAVDDLIGNATMRESLSDEYAQQMQNPHAEFLGIDMSEFSTNKEEVVSEYRARMERQQPKTAKDYLTGGYGYVEKLSRGGYERFKGFFRRKQR